MPRVHGQGNLHPQRGIWLHPSRHRSEEAQEARQSEVPHPWQLDPTLGWWKKPAGHCRVPGCGSSRLRDGGDGVAVPRVFYVPVTLVQLLGAGPQDREIGQCTRASSGARAPSVLHLICRRHTAGGLGGLCQVTERRSKEELTGRAMGWIHRDETYQGQVCYLLPQRSGDRPGRCLRPTGSLGPGETPPDAGVPWAERKCHTYTHT